MRSFCGRFCSRGRRVAFREGRVPGDTRVPEEEEDAVTRVTYHYVTSLEFRIRGAHLDADTPADAVKEPELW